MTIFWRREGKSERKKGKNKKGENEKGSERPYPVPSGKGAWKIQTQKINLPNEAEKGGKVFRCFRIGIKIIAFLVLLPELDLAVQNQKGLEKEVQRLRADLTFAESQLEEMVP